MKQIFISIFFLLVLSACTSITAPENSEFFSNLNIKENQLVSSPLEITGEAKGNWFFEGSFPIHLLDENNKGLTVALGEAQSEWMTEDFVPFKATLTFTSMPGTTGTLVFQKDNPSGLPENEASYKIPVKF